MAEWLLSENPCLKRANDCDIYEKYMGKGYSLFNEFILEGFENLPEQYSDRIIAYSGSTLITDYKRVFSA